jgi:hypothetical protein
METITIDHIDYRVVVELDDYCSAPPWKEHGGHGLIREEFARRSRPTKGPGEIIIHSDRGQHWLYDVRGSLALAKRDRWGLNDDCFSALTHRLGRVPTPREIRAEAVRLDAEFCQRYLTGRVQWLAVTVTDPDTGESECLGGCLTEWGDPYLTQEARELAKELHSRRTGRWRSALREARERRHWARRDVMTAA